jgi:hypothetical protein
VPFQNRATRVIKNYITSTLFSSDPTKTRNAKEAIEHPAVLLTSRSEEGTSYQFYLF